MFGFERLHGFGGRGGRVNGRGLAMRVGQRSLSRSRVFIKGQSRLLTPAIAILAEPLKTS